MCWHVTTEIICVIIYLLEDEQELSLGMLIRPKHIYNFCLLHDLLGDIAICFATLLYLFTHIWTNLLTQCTQCQFLSGDVFFAGTFTPIYRVPKSQEKYIKISVTEASRSTKMGQRGARACLHATSLRAPLLAAPPGGLGGALPLWCPPSAYIYLSDRKPLQNI